jgi:serine/threonine protein phosphatase PrpC
MARLSRRSDFPRRSDFRVEHAGLSHLGHVRATNEDVWRAEPHLSLFVVADGMGGHAAGEIAAALAVDTLVKSVRAPETAKVIDAFALAPSLDGRRAVFAVLRAAVVRANEAVRAEGERNAERRGMGSTLDAVLFVRNRAFVVHVGDGRVYLVRPAATIQLTHDHDLRASMAAEGRASIASRRGQHNPLLNAIGMRDTVSVDGVFLEIGRGDRLVLCTTAFTR